MPNEKEEKKTLTGQNLLFPIDNKAAAVFSADRVYRYTLWRRWRGNGGNYVQFIGLNPSTADELTDDNTIRCCTGYARRWGYDAFCMTNLFAFRATDPRVMKRAREPVGAENDHYLSEIADGARLIVAVWSIHGGFLNRDREILELFGHRLFCIGTSRDGHPWHPLYKSKELIPIPFNKL